MRKGSKPTQVRHTLQRQPRRSQTSTLDDFVASPRAHILIKNVVNIVSQERDVAVEEPKLSPAWVLAAETGVVGLVGRRLWVDDVCVDRLEGAEQEPAERLSIVVLQVVSGSSAVPPATGPSFVRVERALVAAEPGGANRLSDRDRC